MAVTGSIVSRFVGDYEVDHVPPDWSAGTTYAAGFAVTYSGTVYVSKVGSNTGNQPDTSPTQWEDQTTFYADQVLAVQVKYTGGNGAVVYMPVHHFQIGEVHPTGIPDATTSSATLLTLYEGDIDRVRGAGHIAAFKALVDAAPTRPAAGI